MSIVIKYGFLLSLTVLAHAYGQPPEHRFCGTWRRYSNHHLVEIFVVRPDHSWASDLLDPGGRVTGKEKGEWRQKGDSVTFSFGLPAQSPVTMPFNFKNGRTVVIGKNVYYRH